MIRELTKRGICVSLGKDQGGDSGELLCLCRRQPGAEVSLMVSPCGWAGWHFLVSPLPWPVWRTQTHHKRGPRLVLQICCPLYGKGQVSLIEECLQFCTRALVLEKQEMIAVFLFFFKPSVNKDIIQG